MKRDAHDTARFAQLEAAAMVDEIKGEIDAGKLEPIAAHEAGTEHRYWLRVLKARTSTLNAMEGL